MREHAEHRHRHWKGDVRPRRENGKDQQRGESFEATGEGEPLAEESPSGGVRIPPKPRRSLLRHFSLRYTLLSLAVMGVVVAAVTWLVITTPRWLAERGPQPEELSEEAKALLATIDQHATSSNEGEGPLAASEASATSSSATSSPVASLPPRVRIKETETGWLNVREGPSTTYRRLRRVLPGEVYPYTEKRDGWYRIELGEGEYGWVSGTYVEELPAQGQ